MSKSASQYRQVKALLRQKGHSRYDAFREALRIVTPYEWRRKAVNFVRSRFGIRTLSEWLRANFSGRRPPLPRKVFRRGDFFEAITLLPQIPETEVNAILDNRITATRTARPDVICFSIVDWSFRFQRPQQLMTQFAANGHRVFYLSTSRTRSPYAVPRFELKEFGENLFEVQIATNSALEVFSRAVEDRDLELSLESLDELRRACNINEAIAYVMIPSWGKTALATQQRWGWRVIYDCMDEWENFPKIDRRLIDEEKLMVRSCDLLVVTAQRLYDKWREYQRPMILARSEDNSQLIEQKENLARQHTWIEQYNHIFSRFKETVPRASIIIVTYNNLVLTRLCLESIFRNTDYPNYEVIVVDNYSTDGTRKYFEELSRMHDNFAAILNDVNYGFAKANNQGIKASKGCYLVLLNNDTIVPQGWLSRLLAHLRDPKTGLAGPVTNFAGNEAKIDVSYRTWAEMEAFSQDYTWGRQGRIADIHMLAMFCVGMRKEIFESVGPLDEQFGIGMFEDDDYSMRVRQLGYRVICAADTFVHHFGQAAFGKLIRSGDYDRLFDENRRKYEEKWGVEWKPHQHALLNFEVHSFEADIR